MCPYLVLYFNGGNVQEWHVYYKYKAEHMLVHSGVQVPKDHHNGKALLGFEIQVGHSLG